MKQDTHTFEFKKKPKERSAIAPAKTGPPPIVWQLAFAHRVEKEISQGFFPNRAAAAKHYGITRARLTQIMNLLWLSPWTQEMKLSVGGENANHQTTERAMRKACAHALWEKQGS